jgi:RimJ/RimL family protein N-acetyltransferase
LAGARPARQDIGVQPETIATGPLHIRPLAEADIAPIYLACQDPLVQKWAVSLPVPYARADAEWFVMEHCPASWATDRECTWGIEDPRTREFLGVISLRILGDGGGEVGYWLAPGARGRGAATQALERVCRYGFERLGHQVIAWRAAVGNEASRRVAERIGFQLSSPIRRLLHRRGEWLDGWQAALLPTDRPPARLPDLTDGDVVLRAPRSSDLTMLPDLVDDEVLAWTGVPGRSPEQLQGYLDAIRRPDQPPGARFAISEGSGQVHGFVRLSRDPLSEAVSVGWWLGPQARGRGYAYRGVRLALEWSAAHGAPRFAAGIFEGNRASVALAERLGMRNEGLRRGYWPARAPGGPRRDTWLYSLLPTDPGWPSPHR